MHKTSKLGACGFAFLGLLVASAACSSSSSSGGLPADQTVTALRGTIKSAAGQPLAGVTVRAGGVTATSNAQGRFDLRAPAGKATARFAKDGFVDGVRVVTLVDGRPTQLDVTLLPLAPAIPLDATTGGSVTGARTAGLVAPANAFVDASGRPVTGTVDVHLTPLDPSVAAERAAAPGFVAVPSGGTAMLESFGMMDVTVKQGDQKLQVAAGKELEVRIPAPAGGGAPEPSMPLWSYDEDKGAWIEEGVATYDAATKTYVGKAKHMSMWNADKVYLATCICGLVKEKGGAVLPGARVEADGLSYLGSSSTNTGLDGRFCVAVRKDSDVSVAAYHKSGGGQARTIKSGGADTDVPPTMGDPRCADVGVWEVERDVFVTNDGSKIACGSVANPFASGCAAELGAAFGTCFKPEGACTTRIEAGSSVIRYANGAYVTSSGTESRYYSSSGQLCATATFTGGAAGDTFTVSYALPSGKTFTMTMQGDGGGDTIITCPGGGEVRVTPEQRQALEACSNGNGESQETQCASEGSDGGNLPSTCVDDTTCNGNVCCTIPNSTQKYCLPEATCDAIGK